MVSKNNYYKYYIVMKVIKIIKLTHSSIIIQKGEYLDNSYLSNIVLKNVYKNYISALINCNIVSTINLSKDIINIINFLIKNYNNSNNDITKPLSKISKNIMTKHILDSCNILRKAMKYTKAIFPSNTRSGIISILIENGENKINSILEYVSIMKLSK